MTGGSSVISEYGRCFFLDLRREGRSTTEAMQNLTQVFVLTKKKKKSAENTTRQRVSNLRSKKIDISIRRD